MSRNKPAVAYYITPHGFGHAVRSLEVIHRFLEIEPDYRVIPVSDIPEFLVEENVGRRLPMRRRRLDVGLVQLDSIRFDLDATLSSLERLYSKKSALIEEEIRFLKENGVEAVVCDIPFIPFPAAAECGIPATGIGNFTWDWIYTAYIAKELRWQTIISWIRECYRLCTLFLQLPMHGDCSVCPNIEHVPLIARHSTRDPGDVRRILGIPADRKAILVSFTTLDLSREAQKLIERIEDVLFYFRRPLSLRFSNARCLDKWDLAYVDIVASMDAVLTKPGYGIVSDCLAQGIPMIYTDRGVFPEYEILVREMSRSLAVTYLPSEDLYAGRWEPSIRRIGCQVQSRTVVRTDGAEVCAEFISKQLTKHGCRK